MNAFQRLAVALSTTLLLTPASSVIAQSASNFPSKPIRLVVTFPPGGAPDILARMVAEKINPAWGQAVVVDNKAGAGGNIGADFVAKSANDGHTLVMGTVGTHSINGSLYAKMPYDMVKDFSPVTLVASTPNLLVLNPSVQATTLKELIALAQAKPGQLMYGSPGVGTSVHVSGELFATMSGIKITHVPYKGRAMAIPDLLGGQIQMMFDNMPSALPVVKEGKLRAIGVTSAKRSPSAPDIPTLAELGLAGFEATSWFAVFAPANTPKDILAKWHTELARIYQLPDVQAKLKTLGLDPLLGGPDALATFQRSEIAKWQKVVKDSGAKAE
jgi:tripartite-type tricarboxylate transporter receptor subunit TctC